MKILLVSDLHYVLRQFDWVGEVAGDFDLVVLAGDSLDIASGVPVEAQLVAVTTQLRTLATRTRLVVSSGNHDLTERDASGEKAALWIQELRADGIAVDGDSIELDGAFVTVCPWWDGPVGRQAIADQLARDHERARAQPGCPWVWVYHWPPAESRTTWTGKKFYGDADLSAWIAEHSPDIVLAGHVHEPPFKPEGGWSDRIGTTWVFNPGRQIGPMPCHVVIDLAGASARWWSFAGEEEQDLTADLVLDRPGLA